MIKMAKHEGMEAIISSDNRDSRDNVVGLGNFMRGFTI